MLAVASMTLGFQAPVAAPARVNARMATDDLKSLATSLNPVLGYYDPLSAPFAQRQSLCHPHTHQGGASALCCGSSAQRSPRIYTARRLASTEGS